MSNVGFIGLGNMGNPMASRLSEAGYTVYVHDRDSEAVRRLVREQPAVSVLEDDSWQLLDVLITMLPTSAIVEGVLLDQRAAQKLRRDALIIDMSSSEPTRSRELGRRLEAEGMRYLDAPVSGGVRGAQNGQLAIMVGGRWQDLEEARDLFDVLGKSVIHVGHAGSGHAAKALNNLVSAASVAATVEALKTARAFGIDEEVFIAVLNASSGRSYTSENKAAQFMLNGTFGSGFPIGLMTKDIKIATALADSLGVEARFSHDCEAIWQSVLDAGHGAEDHTRMYEFLAKPTTPAFKEERQIHA